MIFMVCTSFSVCLHRAWAGASFFGFGASLNGLLASLLMAKVVRRLTRRSYIAEHSWGLSVG
ncbi:hypothetical protein, partial [Mitsuokella jalaludinii]|uniref:hypothetical protein n=1 Tax=Mitsuokella jalaludinii TaxID=187979 RepID=UPI003079B2CC